MAYSGTANVANHVMKPLSYGNPVPIVRYLAGGYFGGAALWALYDKLLGDKPPKMNESFKAQAFQNMAKAETLGLATGFINPYAPPMKGTTPVDYLRSLILQDSIMQPAIVRNTANLGTMAYGLYQSAAGRADWKKPIPEFIKESVVVVNHLNKGLTNKTTPYKTEIEQSRKFKKQWMMEQHPELYNWLNNKEVEVRGSGPRQQYYQLIRESFLNNDLDLAARYYAITWYWLYDSYRVMDLSLIHI